MVQRDRLRNGVRLLAALVGAAALLFGPGIRDARADMQVTAEVSPQSVTPGAQVQYMIRLVSNTEQPDARELRFETMPQFQGLRPVQQTPFQRTQTEFVNGVMKCTMQITWPLVAEAEGEARITAGRLTYKGAAYDLPALAVSVGRAVGGAVPEDLQALGILPAGADSPEITAQIQGRLFARLILSNPKPFLQETVQATCVIYADGLADSIRQVGWDAPPWADLFAEKTDLGELRFRPETLGAKTYQAVSVQQFLLTPTRAGTLEIPLSQATCALRVRRQGDSFEDQFFGGFPSLFENTVAVRLPIARQSLEVRPLPAEGCPPSFQNAVGAFSFAARVDRTQMTEDDLLTLVLEVGGQGFLGSVSQPKLPSLDGWKQVGSQTKTEAPGATKSLGGKKVFEVLLRPERNGVLPIPGIAYAFFDPAQNRYVEQTGGPFSIQVQRGSDRQLIVAGAPGPVAAPSPGATPAPGFFGEQPAYIQTALPVRTAPSLYRTNWYIFAQLFPLFVLGLAGALRGWRSHRARHQADWAVRRAGGRARRELREAHAALRRQDMEGFHLQLGEAVRGYLATHLQRSATGLTLEETERLCRERGVSADQMSVVRSLLERCDQARYLSPTAGAGDAAEMLRSAERLLKELDKCLL